MAILLMLLASCFVSFSNFFMRKSIDCGGRTLVFLVFQMGVACGVGVLLNPVRTGDFAINIPVVGLGSIAGLCLAGLLFCLGRSLENGPPGFTFSVLNGATVVPGMVMAWWFGALFGFPYTIWHALGSLLVVAGLLWAGRGMDGVQNRAKWIIFATTMFSLHILLLLLFQWRALLLNSPLAAQVTSLVTVSEIQSQWFMPIMFFVSFVVQVGLFFSQKSHSLSLPEVGCGVLGGVANGLCTYLMIWSTEVATPLENAVIYPIFSVATILISNVWGERLYQEKVNWKACQLAAFGLVIGTVNWHAVAALLGF